MASGVFAAEAFLEARDKGDFSRASLAAYRRRLDASWVMKDLAHYRDAVHFLRTNREMVDDYPRLAIAVLRDYFTVDETPKAEVRRRIVRKVRDEVTFLRLARQMWRARKTLV
jgi:electron transfer flavoprotein-quinone oxidoreductase